MVQRKKYTLEDVAAIAKALSAVHAKPKAEKDMTASAVVVMLSKEIKGLQSRGYNMKEIAALLKDNNLPVGVATLKSALSRSPTKKKVSNDEPVANQSRPAAAAPAAPKKEEGKPGKFTPTPDTTDI